MTLPPVELDPVEEQVRTYLRGRTSLMALVNGNDRLVNMDWKAPKGADSTANPTRVTFYLAGGPWHPYLPLQEAVVTFHCWGSTRPAAAGLAVEVARSVLAITQADKPLRSGSVESINWLPADAAARYVVTTVVTTEVPVNQT